MRIRPWHLIALMVAIVAIAFADFDSVKLLDLGDAVENISKGDFNESP